MYDYCGQMVKGYEINERIGAGSFGAVYRAFQPAVGREVAIKIILPAFANHPDFIRRFEAEAQLIARLEHPHIVPLFDYWREPESAFLVMRLLPGSLRRLMETHALRAQHVAQIVDQIASALALSHRQGVIHRDVKPDNILIDGQGNAYLTDFGLAKVTETHWRDDDEHTAGSPSYMAPEQITGQETTAHADIYALGVVIYEIFAGHTPFGGLHMASLINRKLKHPFPMLSIPDSRLADALNPIIQRATARELSERYQDIRDIARDVRRALIGEEGPPVSLADTAEVENPYKGLRAFEEADASDFYGREALVHQLVTMLQGPGPYARFLAIVGPSGSGKSSLVKAGLMPALRRGAFPGSDSWFLTAMLPGGQPLHQLETALLSVARSAPDDLAVMLRSDRRGLVRAAERILGEEEGDLLLVIDQFEELFTLVSDEAERAHFLGLLQTAVTDPDSRVRVVITLRADFYDRPLLYEDFGALMQARTQVVLPLTTDELERAIVTPAQRVGVQIDPNLVTAMIADVHEEPGALPLLQYALTEVFERREGRHLRLADYEAIGRAAGALARRADSVFAQLSPVQQAIAQQVFLRLVTLGEGTEDTRRRVEQAELASVLPDAVTLHEVLETFGRHRLLSFDRVPDTRAPTVEVAHEALLREWGRLRLWLDSSREDVRQQRRLARRAAEWEAAGYDPSFLLRGVQMEQFVYWQNHSRVSLGQSERAYMTASIQVHEAQQEEEKARLVREKLLEARAQRFWRGLLVVMFLALVVALILSLLAVDQREEAQRARRAAEDSARRAQIEAEAAATAASIAERRANELQSLALVEDAERVYGEGNIDLALVLAIEANRLPNPPVRAQRALSSLAPLAAVRVMTWHSSRVNAVAFSPDGVLALSGGDDGTLVWWDVATGQRINNREEEGGRIRSIAFLPSGDQVVIAGDNGLLVLVDAATGETVRALDHPGDVFAVAVSPDGTLIASGGRDQIIRLWDTSTGSLVNRLGTASTGHRDRVTALAFSPDGTALASGGADARVIIWDVATGRSTFTLAAHNDAITDLAYAPSGAPGGGALLTASIDALVYWETERYTVVHRLQGHTERVNGVAFSPDGRFAASAAGNPFAAASTDNSVILWDIASGQIIRRFTGHAFQVTDVAFSPDGHYLVTASADATLRLWDIAPQIELARLSMDNVKWNTAAALPDGSQALASTDSGQLVAISLDPANPEQRVLGPALGVNAIAINPDATRALTASLDRKLTVWDLATNEQIRTLTGHVNSVNDVVFLPDGRHAVSVSRDRQVILWDVDTGERVRVFETRHTNSINAVDVNAEGTTLVTASADQTLVLWDVATGSVLHTLTGHLASVTLAVFDPTGRWVLSGSQDKTLIVWDVATGEALMTLGTAGAGHTDWITTAAFSPDGQWVWSGSRDRTVRLWDIASGQIIRTYTGFDDSVTWLAPDPAGQVILASTADGGLAWLPASSAALMQWVETNRYVRPLTCDERIQFQLPECDSVGSRSIFGGSSGPR